MNPTCGHADHFEDGIDVDEEPAVAKYEGTIEDGVTFEYWTCEEHEPEDGVPIERVKQ